MKIKPNKGDRWSRDEMIVVLNLYFKLPYGKLDHRTLEVKELARLMGRTDNTVAMRLNNFASCDPKLIERGIKALGDQKKRCQPLWDEFYNDQEKLIYESERILAEYQDTDIETKYKTLLDDIPINIKGETRLRIVKRIDINQLLVASHIIPWASNETERMNPENGICLSSLYDKAFDKGLISFTNDGKVIFSDKLKENVGKHYYNYYFSQIEGQYLSKPNKYNPNPLFLEWHRDVVFCK